MKFAACMAFSFIISFRILLVPFFMCMYGCIICMLLFIFVNYVFLFLCILIVMYVLFCIFCFHCVVLCVCVFVCTVLMPPGINPLAVNK